MVKRIPKDFEDLLSQVEKYINMEEAQKHKRDSLKKERGDQEVRTGIDCRKEILSGVFPNTRP